MASHKNMNLFMVKHDDDSEGNTTAANEDLVMYTEHHSQSFHT